MIWTGYFHPTVTVTGPACLSVEFNSYKANIIILLQGKKKPRKQNKKELLGNGQMKQQQRLNIHTEQTIKDLSNIYDEIIVTTTKLLFSIE